MARRLKGDGEAVELEVDEVALGVAGLAAGGDVGAAGLLDGDGEDGDAQAVGTDEVLTAVAAGELLAVAADGVGGHGLAGDLGVAIRAALGGGEGNSGHGGDEESLEEGHFG